MSGAKTRDTGEVDVRKSDQKCVARLNICSIKIM